MSAKKADVSSFSQFLDIQRGAKAIVVARRRHRGEQRPFSVGLRPDTGTSSYYGDLSVAPELVDNSYGKTPIRPEHLKEPSALLNVIDPRSAFSFADVIAPYEGKHRKENFDAYKKMHDGAPKVKRMRELKLLVQNIMNNHSHLVLVRLTNAKVGDDECKLIANAMKMNRVVRTLTLNGNHITNAGIKYLAKMLNINNSLVGYYCRLSSRFVCFDLSVSFGTSDGATLVTE
jgi:hypothetical protein